MKTGRNFRNSVVNSLYVYMHTSLALWKHRVSLLLQSFRSVSSDLHISTDEDPTLRIESFVMINVRDVSKKLNSVVFLKTLIIHG